MNCTACHPWFSIPTWSFHDFSDCKWIYHEFKKLGEVNLENFVDQPSGLIINSQILNRACLDSKTGLYCRSSMTFIPNLAIFLILKESCLEIKKHGHVKVEIIQDVNVESKICLYWLASQVIVQHFIRFF